MNWVSTLSPRTIFNLRSSFSRYLEASRSDANLAFDLTELGFSKDLPQRLGANFGFGICVLDGYIQLGRGFSSNGCTEANWLIVPRFNPRYHPTYDGRVRLQPVAMADASINKTTRLTERLSAQFRAECFNVANSFFVVSQQFNNNPENVQFGSLIKAAVSAPNSNYPRRVQLGFKLLW